MLGKWLLKNYGVIHYCVPNIASRVSQTASMALNNIFVPLMLNIGREAGIDNLIRQDEGLRIWRVYLQRHDDQ